jgi:hypothetical protein
MRQDPNSPQNLLLLTKRQSGSVGPVENVSGDFYQMNRGTDVITEKRIEGKTESDRIKRLETRLTELEAEKDIIEREKGHSDK